MDKILGIVYAYDVKEGGYQKIRDLGFSWLRMMVSFPWEDQMFGTLSQEYLNDKEDIRKAYEAGFNIMPTTPGLGAYQYDEQEGEMYYHDFWPEFVGEKGSMEFYENVAATNEFICNDLGIMASDIWLCMNEIDIPIFSGPYSMDISVKTARACARGIVRANPNAKCGINLSRCNEESMKVADLVYAPGHCFGFVGDDQYFGSWQGHTVETWNVVIDTLYERYHLPVLACEWGYSSGGDYKEERPDESLIPEGLPEECYGKCWYHQVEGGHTEEVQAKYLRRGLEIFASNPHVMGSFLFCFQDAKRCYHCGEPDCPSECFWGIVDADGEPKKAYEAVREAISNYYEE